MTIYCQLIPQDSSKKKKKKACYACHLSMPASVCVQGCLIRLRATQDSNIPKPILLFAFSNCWHLTQVLVRGRNSRWDLFVQSSARLGRFHSQELPKRLTWLTFNKQPRLRHPQQTLAEVDPWWAHSGFCSRGSETLLPKLYSIGCRWTSISSCVIINAWAVILTH